MSRSSLVLMLVMLFTLSSASDTTLPATTSPASFIMGESALIDKETGRIFWEGGISNTLTSMLGSKVRTLLQVHHLRATILSSILWIGIVRALADRWTVSDAANKVLRMVQWTLLLLPRFDTWFLWTMALFYGIESYFCTTRQYLTHCIASTEELEAYLEQIREVAPRVEWKVRSFHYEIISHTLVKIVGALQNMTATSPLEQPSEVQAFLVNSTDTMVETQRDLPSWMKRKKVTNFTIGTYQYQDCIDKTLASVWKRAKGSYYETSLVSKITLSKLLVLSDSKTRRDYFKQQAAFVSEHCQSDTMAEFATNIVIPGFKPRLLAIRHRLDESLRARIALQFVSLPWFWCFTLLGLTAPYRFWFDDQCDELRVSVVKETSVEPRKVGALNNNKVPWFWSRYASVNNNDDECILKEESNKFRVLMQELQLYGNPSSDPLSNKEGVINQNEELRKDELQDVIDSVKSASLLAKEETSSDSL